MSESMESRENQVETRIEYRVVSTGAIRQNDHTSEVLTDLAVVEGRAADARLHWPNVQIQKRTVTETPWSDVDAGS